MKTKLFFTLSLKFYSIFITFNIFLLFLLYHLFVITICFKFFKFNYLKLTLMIDLLYKTVFYQKN